MRLLEPDTPGSPGSKTSRLAAPRGTQGSAFLTYRSSPDARLRAVIPGLAFRRRARQRLRRPRRQHHQRAASAASASRLRERAPSNHLQPYRHLRQRAPSRAFWASHPLTSSTACRSSARRSSSPLLLAARACRRRWLLFTHTNTIATPRQLSLASGWQAELKRA